MQVFDLTRLRDVNPSNSPAQFTADAVYRGIGLSNTHNLDINEDSGFAYLVGTNTCNAGLHMVDIRDPEDAAVRGLLRRRRATRTTRSARSTKVPDERYTGREICFASNEDTVTIVDVTDKTLPRSCRARATPRRGTPTRAG